MCVCVCVCVSDLNLLAGDLDFDRFLSGNLDNPTKLAATVHLKHA